MIQKVIVRFLLILFETSIHYFEDRCGPSDSVLGHPVYILSWLNGALVKMFPIMTGMFSVLLPYTAYLALSLRVWVGANLVAHGYPKLEKAKAQTLQWTKSLGVPTVATYLAIILEFFGGLSLIIGFIVPIVGFFLAAEMIGIIYLKKVKMKVPYMGQNSYEIDITYLMLAIVLIALGAGVLSVDAFLGF